MKDLWYNEYKGDVLVGLTKEDFEFLKGFNSRDEFTDWVFLQESKSKFPMINRLYLTKERLTIKELLILCGVGGLTC